MNRNTHLLVIFGEHLGAAAGITAVMALSTNQLPSDEHLNQLAYSCSREIGQLATNVTRELPPDCRKFDDENSGYGGLLNESVFTIKPTQVFDHTSGRVTWVDMYQLLSPGKFLQENLRSQTEVEADELERVFAKYVAGPGVLALGSLAIWLDKILERRERGEA